MKAAWKLINARSSTNKEVHHLLRLTFFIYPSSTSRRLKSFPSPPPLQISDRNLRKLSGIVAMAANPPGSPFDAVGIYNYQAQIPLVSGDHNTRNAPCPYGHGTPGPCNCICFECMHRLRLGTAMEVERYRRNQRDSRRPEPQMGNMPCIEDPPRRVFTRRTKLNPPRPPPAQNQWGSMARLPREVRDMISAYVGDFSAGVAALSAAGLTENPLDPRSHNILTLALWQNPCTENGVFQAHPE